MNEYLKLFIDDDYPYFIDKYLQTKTLNRIKFVSQFCGADYTRLYSPLFFYTRFDHSLVVAHMTWHFTHDKTETICALLHDVGTPCFAHCIDYVLGDYINQESSEKSILDIIKNDSELLLYLKEDDIDFNDLQTLSKFPILENKAPKLCTDRLDGILHSCYIWLHTSSLQEIKEVYDNISVLTNEDNNLELGFLDKDLCERFVSLVSVYTKELQGNKDKYMMKYICEIVKLALTRNLITLDNLYTLKEEEVINIFNSHFKSWEYFSECTDLIRTNEKPTNFYISFETKKRNVIPLIKTNDGTKRITDVSLIAKEIYESLEDYQDSKYAYVKNIKNIY